MKTTPTIQYILWIVAGLALAFFLLPLISRLGKRKYSIDKQGEVVTAKAVPSAKSGPKISDAEATAQSLASKGNFTDAVHYLWLEILQDLQSMRINNISPADTGRDIVRNLKNKNKGVLADGAEMLLRAVELTWFGGRKIEEEQYRSCYDAYLRVKQAIGVGPGPEAVSQ